MVPRSASLSSLLSFDNEVGDDKLFYFIKKWRESHEEGQPRFTANNDFTSHL